MEIGDLFDLLDVAGNAATANPPALNVLNATLVTLKRSTSTLESDGIPPLRLNQLLSLHLLVPDSIILEDMIAMAIDASLPMGYDGRQLSFASGIRLGALSARSEMRWSCRLNQLPAQLDFYSFLTQESWTTSTVKILSGILYQQSFARRVFLRWLSSETCAQRSMLHLANVLCAFLDSSSAQGAEINDTESETLIPWFSRLCELVVDPLNSQELQSVCGTCIPLVISLCPSKKSDLIATLLKRVQQMPSVTFHILALGNQLHASIRADSDDIVDCLVDKGLRWTVRAFHEAEGELEKIVVMLSGIAILLNCNK